MSARARQSMENSASEDAAAKIRLVYVDDEPSLLEVTKEFMEASGDFQVDTFPSARDALAAMSEGSHSAVVSDYKMPDIDGIDFLKYLRTQGNDIPFILFTGKGREEIAIEALNSGADFYLNKGGDPKAQFAELANMIRQAVEKREAEDALAYNLRHFRALIENATDMIIEIGSSGNVKYASPSITAILGYRQEDIIGRPWLEFIHPDDAEFAVCALAEVLEKGQIPGSEIRIRARNGEWRFMEGGAVRIGDGSTSIVINARDVSDRRRMLDRLNRLNRMLSLISEVNQTIVRVRDRDELFRKLCEIAVEKGNLSMAWVGMVDPGTGMILPAASCGDNGGYLEGIRISTGDVPEGQGPIGMAVRKNVVSVVADIAVDDRMGPWKDRAARLGYHSTAGLPIRLHGKPIGALGIYSPEVGGFDDEVIRLLEEAAEDISLAISSIDTETKHRATEALLAESEERFRTAFEGAAIGMVMVGPDMKFIDVNRSFCAILGRTREELMSGGFISVTHPDDAEASQLWVQRMLAGEDVPMNLEKRYVHKDGHVIWAEVSTTLLKDRRGKPRYFITEIKDISERLRTAAQLDELERSLQLSRRRLSLLTELTRHDILNQLTASLGYLELARGGTKEEDALKDLERLRVSLERIQKLAEFTRMYQDVGFAAPEWQSVGALVSVSADQIAASRIELVADCGDYQVFADRMLESVIRNLMDNSVRHGRNVKNIRVACALSSEALKIVYEDDGIGIAEADKERVFERGFGAGSGIGLLLAREILAITNISIVENGQPGRGARFEMTVPPESWRRP